MSENNSNADNSAAVEEIGAFLSVLRDKINNGEITAVEALSIFKSVLGEMTDFFIDMFATVLAPADRRHMIATGVRSQGFVSVCRENVRLAPYLLPADLSPDRMEEDYADLEQKQSVHDVAKRLADITDDTQLAASDAVRHNSLAFYRSAVEAAKRKVPGAKAVHDNMYPYFKRGSAKTPPAPPAVTEGAAPAAQN